MGQGSEHDNVPSHTTLLVKNISPQNVHVLFHMCWLVTHINYENISMYMFILESSQNSAIKLKQLKCSAFQSYHSLGKSLLHKLDPPVLAYLDALMDKLLWYIAQASHHTALDIFKCRKTLTLKPHFSSMEEPKVIRCEVFRIQRLQHEHNLSICQELLHCHN